MSDSRAAQPTPSNWFRDAESLVAAVRRAHPVRAVPPSIPGYDDVRELHRGGQGVVYEATQRSTRRRVAIKVLLDGALASDAARRRFEREVDVVAALRHPHIVGVYDSGTTATGQPYLVMELAEGVALDQWQPADHGSSLDPAEPLRRRIEVFERVCTAVSHAHQHGVIHRDLKPSNIRVDAAGTPRVLDFGLAKATSEGAAPAVTITESGRFVGSLPWASPEQARGDASGVDTRSDVYSLGVILFQLITGRFPYDVGSGLRSALENIISAEPSRPSSISPHARGDLETIVLRCLAKDPARRYQSAAELTADIGSYLAGEPIAARRDSAWHALRRRVARYRAAAIAAGAIVVVSVAATIVSLAYWRQSEDSRERAEQKARLATSTLGYLKQALRSPDPSVRGRDVRVADVLDQAAKDAGDSLADQPETLIDIRTTLATTYLSLSLFDQAEEQAGAALDLAKRTKADEAPEAVHAAGALARARFHKGRHAEAEALSREWLEVARRVLGPEDPTTLALMNTRMTVLGQMGRYAESEPLARDLLEVRTRTLGPEHTDTLTTLGRLGQMLVRQSKLKEAEEVMQRVLEVRTRVLGPEAPDTISAMCDVANIRQQRGDADGAHPLFERAGELSARVNGPEHAMTLIIANNRANSLVKLERPKEAEEVYRQLLETQRRLRGPEHEQVLSVTNGLANCLRRQGRADEAEALARQAVETAARTLGPTHPSTLAYTSTLASCLLSLGRPEEALAAFQQAWTSAKEKLGEPHVLTSALRAGIARALLALKRFDEAEAHALAAHERISAALGPASSQTLDAINDLVAIYEGWGKTDEAAAWRTRAHKPAPH